ncbi:alanine racemase [Nocardioides sp. CER19]|uniref:alanine racemase n=1 Tax=Nocardioides sp. CER19 TaxID=3038538 RepID=UPI0024498216|nr:alanine racemase [Nocardioides sp. CER19]MDH2413559.1 alanine racemase [Nocardioides sp. CER19]
MSRAELVVDVAAIRHNIRRLGEFTATPVMAVVKADGYGHGMLPAARAAREAGVPWLGVATVDEALALRDDGDAGRVLCWLTVPGDDLMPPVARGIDITAYTVDELDRIAEATQRAGRKARVQLKIDTGLSRGGSTLASWPDLVARARAGEETGTWTVTGIWSHFSSSEVPDDPANATQEKLFREALDLADEAGLRPEVRHLANSAAAILRPSARFDLVRCGIAAYGLDPAPGLTPPELDLRPAMTARADLALVKHVDAGAAVSYNGRWVAPEATTLGLVPVGYADGILRSAGNRGEVLVAGRRRPIRGSVCMDQVVVDLSGDEPTPGDPVIVLGPGTSGEPTAQDWAEATGTISYEIVTRLGGRFARRVVDSESDREI